MFVGEVEPGGAFVVEVGQGAFRQLLGEFGVARDQTRVADRAEAVQVGGVDVTLPWARRRASMPASPYKTAAVLGRDHLPGGFAIFENDLPPE